MESDNFTGIMTGYQNFYCPSRDLKPRQCSSSSVINIFVKNCLIENGLVKQIYCELEDCVLQFIENMYSQLPLNTVLGLTYIYSAWNFSLLYMKRKTAMEWKY